MTAEVHSPYPQFFDLAGKPIDGGYIYYGVAGQAPESNPITVYWDAAATIPATQPIRTIAGYPARSGAPANIFVNSEYSVLIKDKNSVTVAQRDAVNPGLGYPAPYSTIALAKVDSLLTPGQTVVTLGYWESYDGGEAIYSVRAVADFSADMVTAGLIGTPDNKIDHLIFGGALVLQLQHNRIIDTAQCGVREGYESGDAWNNAFWRAAALSTPARIAEARRSIRLWRACGAGHQPPGHHHGGWRRDVPVAPERGNVAADHAARINRCIGRRIGGAVPEGRPSNPGILGRQDRAPTALAEYLHQVQRHLFWNGRL